MIGKFTKGVLIIKINNKEFYGSKLIEHEGKRLSNEVIQAITNNEAMVATDVKVKNKKIGMSVDN